MCKIDVQFWWIVESLKFYKFKHIDKIHKGTIKYENRPEITKSRIARKYHCNNIYILAAM